MSKFTILVLYSSMIILASAFVPDYDEMTQKDLKNCLAYMRFARNSLYDNYNNGNMDELVRFSRSRAKFTPDLVRPRFGKRGESNRLMDRTYSLDTLDQMDDKK